MSKLADKFDLTKPRQLLSGSQAIVRLLLMQKERDRAAGLNTAGYVSGYRGSPLSNLEVSFAQAAKQISDNNIKFQSGLNEDLAATAIWGAQQAELRGEGKYDGVFALWYGKGPGVDRSGDVLRHANHAGTARNGGVLALAGDDHTCESSTSAHQSDFAFVDAMIPVLAPSNVQDILDYGLAGIAMSRFTGLWVGMKCVKDNAESTSVVDASVDRLVLRNPTDEEYKMPPGGLNIFQKEEALEKEARLHDHKRQALHAFVRTNKLDKVVWSGGAQPEVGIVSAGKSYLDVQQALEYLGIDETLSSKIGLKLYKPAVIWPLEPQGVIEFAQGLKTIIVVEEKRSLIETQFKEILYDVAVRPRVIGKKDERGETLFPAKGALDPISVAIAIGKLLQDPSAADDGTSNLTDKVKQLENLSAKKLTNIEAFSRIPYFCAGCPHNSSTVIPEGGRAYAGIGCHYMAQWMDRDTDGFTQMGAEGANWIGESSFSTREHVFQNIGDGTFIHSGSLALRAAIAANARMTYKILYNDAVAMTGGQALEGGMTAEQMATIADAEGATKVAIVSEDPDRFDRGALPHGCKVHHRDELMSVQEDLAEQPGVTVLIYDQTCATEKRRRRKRGLMPQPDERVFINPLVCEGCGDCGQVSNCVALQPLDTPFGRKRTIDQSACNIDTSCVKGFCPSFVTLKGAIPIGKAEKIARAGRAYENAFTELFNKNVAEPDRPALDRPFTVLVTGIGGTGVVTISAVLGQAAYNNELGFGAIDVTGLAQKGGAVTCHIRIADTPAAIGAIRVGTAGADVILGGDLVVAASTKVLDLVNPGHTKIVVSPHEQITGDFTRDPNLQVPGEQLITSIKACAGHENVSEFDAQAFAVKLFGDSIFANMALLGYAYQKGLIPVSAAAIQDAISLNNTAVEKNRQAFHAGRVAAAYPKILNDVVATQDSADDTDLTPNNETLEDMVTLRAEELAAYQVAALGDKYRAAVEKIANLEDRVIPGENTLARAVARAYFKLLAYKDEYEVARLYTDGRFEAYIRENFTDTKSLEFHMAPPLLSEIDPSTGRPRKMRFGAWMRPVLGLLAKGRRLRGTWADPFGYTEERRHEREMIAEYETLIAKIMGELTDANHAVAVELASLPLTVRGFGHVKEAAAARAELRKSELLAEFRTSTPQKARITAN